MDSTIATPITATGTAITAVYDDEIVTAQHGAQLALGWVTNATFPYGTIFQDGIVWDGDDGSYVVEWNTSAMRPDSHDPTTNIPCPWGGSITIDAPVAVGELKRQVWSAMFLACVRDQAHEIAEQLSVAGLFANPHADDVGVAMGDKPAWEDIVTCDTDALAARLF